MAEILLPARGNVRETEPRRRGGVAPNAENVPQSQGVRDPGVTIARSRAGEGLEDIGRALAQVGDAQDRAMVRQQKEYDATKTAEAKLAFNRFAAEEFARLRDEDDPSRPEFIEDFGVWLGGKRNAETKVRGGAGLIKSTLDNLPKNVSDTAKNRLRLSLIEATQGFERQAGALSLKEADARAKVAISDIARERASQAQRNPDFVTGILSETDQDLEAFGRKGREQLPAVRAEIIESGIVGLVEKNRIGEARQLFADSAADLSPKDQRRIDRALNEHHREAAREEIVGWFNAQPDPLAAASALRNGRISDERVAALYKSLPPDERSKAFRAAVDDYGKIATLRNQEREEGVRQQKEAHETIVRDFFFDEDMSPGQRTLLLDSVRLSPHIPIRTIQSMDALVRSGGREASFDVEADLAAAETQIRRGEIKSDLDLINAIGKEGWRISIETARTKLIPMIADEQEDVFGDVLRWGRSELGISTGTGLLGDSFKPQVDKAAQFEAAMRRYRKDNPAGDFWAQADRIIGPIKKQASSAVLSALPVIVSAYRNALKSGNADQIGTQRTALITIMVEGSLVSPTDAARADFDPLSIIDKKGQP